MPATPLGALTLPHAIYSTPASAIFFPIALGTAIGYGTRPKDTEKTYLALRQPPLRPPAWVFGPAWTMLYGLMGYASYRAFTTGTSPFASPATVRAAHRGANLYTVQLGLNLIWMPLFFVLRRPIEATVDITTLLALNGYLTYLWAGVDRVAAWCMVPYLAWLGFATYLSAGAGYLNDWDLSLGPAGAKKDSAE